MSYAKFAGLQVDMEEAKSQENKKLQQKLQELELQSNETKDLLKREQETAKAAWEKAALVPEVQVDTTLVNELTAENEKLKVNIFTTVDSLHIWTSKFVHFHGNPDHSGYYVYWQVKDIYSIL